MSSEPHPQPGETNSLPRTDPSDYQRANLGCGDDYRDGWLNVDLEARDVGMSGRACTPDLCHDLNETPWPFPDNCFRHVEMTHVIEHLDDQLATLRELARVVEPGGTIEVTSPHWNAASMAIDPTHTTPLDPRTFNHYLVADLFAVRQVEVETVRWATPLPDAAALWLADVLGHGVVEWTVTAEVTTGSEADD